MAKKMTVNFQKDYKLWKACAKNDVRPALEYVFFKNGYAYASNGWILVRVPLDLCTTFDEEQRELLDGFSIHAPVLKDMVKFEKVSIGKEVVTRDGVDKVLVTLVAQSGDTFITVTLSDSLSVTPPDFEKLLSSEKEKTPIQKVGITPGNAKTLAETMGTKNLKFNFASEKDAIFVESVEEGNESVGIMMPYVLSLD